MRALGDRPVVGLSAMLGLWILTSLETWILFPKYAPGGQDYFKVASYLYEFLALNFLLVFFKRRGWF